MNRRLNGPRDRSDSRGRGRSRSRSRSPPPGRRDYRGYGGSGGGQQAAGGGPVVGGVGGAGGRSHRYSNDGPHHPHHRPPPQRYYRDDDHLPPPSLDIPPARESHGSSLMPPVMSFKSFIQTRKENLSPEGFQQLYEKYQRDYLLDFSEAFFRLSCGEEWFQDRYNPINIITQEKESAQWAVQESLAMKNALLADTKGFVEACSLEPNVRPPVPPVGFRGTNNTSTMEHDRESDNERDGEDEDHQRGRTTSPSSSVVAGRQLEGLEDCTVFVTAIHACCPRPVFRTAVMAILAGELSEPESALQPRRILVSQPTWSPKVMDRFERVAWIVMRTPEAARRAIDLLRGKDIRVPAPLSPQGDAVTAFTFRIQAHHHSRRSTHVLPDFLSIPARVQADLRRAIELAGLLDEDRDVPKDQTLLSLLSTPEVVEFVTSPVQALDMVVAYLRRVHFLAFYAAKRCRDEAHLLTLVPTPSFRAVSYTPEPSDSTTPFHLLHVLGELQGDVKADGLSESVTNEDEAKGFSDEVKASEEEENEERESGRKRRLSDAEEEAGAEPTAPSLSASAGRKPVYSDRRLDALVDTLRRQVSLKRGRAQNPTIPGSMDEEDAAILTVAQNAALEKEIKVRCHVEPDGRCRCCYEYCRKLFKSIDFLSKHLRAKHTDFALDALLHIAIPYMRKRYEAEDLTHRPLPPVEMETGVVGRIELRSVTELLDRVAKGNAAVLLPPPIMSVPPLGGGGYNKPDNNNGGGYRRGGGNDRDPPRRFSGGNGRHLEDEKEGHRLSRENKPFSPPVASNHPSADAVNPFIRKPAVTYMDVDVPKESVVSIDYGVSIKPPVKRRKSLPTASTTATTSAAPLAAGADVSVTTIVTTATVGDSNAL